MIFCDKNYFFGGDASATSSKRQCSIYLSEEKRKEVSSPSRTVKGGRKNKSHTHYHIPQASEKQGSPVRKKENGMARDQQQRRRKKNRCLWFAPGTEKKRRKKWQEKKEEKGEEFNQAKPVDTSPQCHKEKNTTKKGGKAQQDV